MKTKRINKVKGERTKEKDERKVGRKEKEEDTEKRTKKKRE